jgi:DNA-binding CsgD family transcriptional regulator
MHGEKDSTSGRSPEPGQHTGEIAVAQLIAAGDERSWTRFLGAIRPMVTKVAIGWCHRMEPGGRCRHCVKGVEFGCHHFSRAEAMIEDSIRQRAMKAYNGQTALAEFIELLISSEWWFWDWTDSSAERLPHSNTPANDSFRADLVQAWAVLADNRFAWEAFLGAYHKYIEKTAIAWCHRSVPGRVCQRCKPSAHDADHDCDAASEAYAYILGRLRNTALVSYEGRTALGSFVFLCLNDYRWWASFVQNETGKIKLPRALADESELVQKVYYRICWGWDSERIAAGMGLSPERVVETRDRIEEKLRSAGRTVPVRKIMTVSLSAPFSEGDEEEPRVAEPAASNISPEVRSEAVIYWSKLPVQNRTLLRLVAEGKSAKEVAGVLGITAGQVYSATCRIRREMPEWFKM